MFKPRINLSLFGVLLLTLALFLQCSKTGKTKWLYYNQTQCADKWGSYTNNEDLKLKINIVAVKIRDFFIWIFFKFSKTVAEVKVLS